MTRILAIMDKLIEGDDALLQLAKRRFRDAGLGAELYPSHSDHLDHLLQYVPVREAGVAVHLPREIDVLFEPSARWIASLASRFARKVDVLVLHDQEAAIHRLGPYVAALSWLADELEKIPDSPRLHLEFTGAVEPQRYVRVQEGLADRPRVAPGIDTGHVGVWAARRTFSVDHPVDELDSLGPYDPRLPGLMADVQEATAAALPTLLDLIRTLGAHRKPMHFHLHDGHPVWGGSPFGTRDHMSFLEVVPLPFMYEGRPYVRPMYGPEGLRHILAAAHDACRPSDLSLTIEIHPTPGRAALGEDGDLFRYWRDLHHAEWMSHWLEVLAANKRLITEILGEIRGSPQ